MLPPLIGLYSPAPQSGKSTIALALGEYGFNRVRFAGALKAMLYSLLFSAGENHETIDRMIEGDLKEVPSALLAGKTPRWAMQTLGAEWGRSCLGDTLWVGAAMGEVRHLRERGLGVVVDDMRYPNEAEAIRQAGGVLVRVERPSATVTSAHSSEGALDGLRFDLVLRNTYGSAEGFVEGELPKLLEKARWVQPTAPVN